MIDLDAEGIDVPIEDATVGIFNTFTAGDPFKTFTGRLSVIVDDKTFEVIEWLNSDGPDDDAVVYQHDEFDEDEEYEYYTVQTVFVGSMNLFAFTIQ